MTINVTLDDWERDALAQRAAVLSLQYMAHYTTSGLFRDEVVTLNRWRKLNAKLCGEPEPEDLLYKGYTRNGWNPEAD